MVSELQLELSVMQTQERGAKCCKYIKQTILITLILLFLVTFYSVDESVLVIGSLNSNITDVNNKNLATTDCDSLCPSPFLQPLSDSQCCQDSTILSTCKSKQQCSLETLTKYQNQLNNEYLYLFLELGIELVIVFIIAIYCIKRRMERTKRQRQDQNRRNNQNNNHAAVFNIVGSLRIRREYEPPSLQSSFLNRDENSCAICLQSLLEAKAIKLKCHHIFHSSCIKEWMDTKDTCPICRTRN